MKAIVAVATTLLTAAYHMLRDGVLYRHLAPTTGRTATGRCTSYPSHP